MNPFKIERDHGICMMLIDGLESTNPRRANTNICMKTLNVILGCAFLKY